MIQTSPLQRAILTTLLLISVAHAGLNVPAQSQTQTRLDIPSLMAEVESRGQENSAKSRGYTYRLKHIEQQLNDKDEVKTESTSIFQVFPLSNGLPIVMLLSENGKDLSASRLAKERARANKEWHKRKKEIASKPAEPQPLVFLRASEFTLLRTDRYKNRDVLVLAYKPRADFRPANNSEKFVSKLEGEMWIDPVEKMMVKLEAQLVGQYTLGGLSGLFASLRPGGTLAMESAPLADGNWVMTSLEFYSVAKPLLSKTLRTRQRDEFSDHKPFNKDADELPDVLPLSR